MLISECVADSSDVAVESAVVSNNSCNDPKMHEVVVVVEEEVTKGQNVTRRPAAHEMEEVPAPAIPQRNQSTAVTVEAEKVATEKKRTRRSTKSKVAEAAQKEHKGEGTFSLPWFHGLMLIFCLSFPVICKCRLETVCE
jgi:hypothetical protein